MQRGHVPEKSGQRMCTLEIKTESILWECNGTWASLANSLGIEGVLLPPANDPVDSRSGNPLSAPIATPCVKAAGG